MCRPPWSSNSPPALPVLAPPQRLLDTPRRRWRGRGRLRGGWVAALLVILVPSFGFAQIDSARLIYDPGPERDREQELPQATADGPVDLPGYTRLVLDAQRPFALSLWSVSTPRRIMLDLEGIATGAALRGLEQQLSADHPYIRSLRVTPGATATTVTLVLDRAIQSRISTGLRAGERFRVVLDLYPPERPEPPAPASEPPPRQAADRQPEAMDSSGPGTALDEMLLAVTINGQPAGAALLMRQGDQLLAQQSDLQQWRFKLPSTAPLSLQGQAFHSLNALTGLSWELDDQTQTLAITAPVDLFQSTLVSGRAQQTLPPDRAPPGAFLNYDVFTSHSDEDSQTSGRLELGVFGEWGAGISSFLARDGSSRTDGTVRLDTTWTHDRPDRLASLRLGDAISAPGNWSRSVRFGGVQWATNFSTQPGFISFPRPDLTGEAALPSTVELYVNDALRQRNEVPAGPFRIQDLPVINGQGDIRLVVRDILGREQVITRPYYASARLLRQGLHEYSYELGKVRENYGIESNDYGRGFAAVTHRFGLNDHFTGEIHGELLEHQQTLGLSGAFLWRNLGVLSTSLAGSHSERGSGSLWGVGIQRQGRWLSLGANVELADREFVQLGLQPWQLAPKRTSRLFLSIATGRGSLGLNYTSQAYRDRDSVELAGASYQVSLGRLGSAGISVLRFLSGEESTTVNLSFTLPLGSRTTASLSGTANAGADQAALQIQRNLPAGSGFGYRLRTSVGEPGYHEAGISAQNDAGTYAIDVARTDQTTAFRGNISGGLIAFGDGIFPSRRVDRSFAAVQVPGYSGVRVYADNQVVAVTDRRGRALVPRIRAYEANPIRIEQADLPMDVQIKAIEMVAVPRYRSGVLLRFPVKRSRGALFKVILEDGTPLPAGATAGIVGGSAERFPAGLEGEIYLTGLAAENRVRIEWRGQHCEFELRFPETTEPLPHLGTQVCTGVTP